MALQYQQLHDQQQKYQLCCDACSIHGKMAWRSLTQLLLVLWPVQGGHEAEGNWSIGQQEWD